MSSCALGNIILAPTDIDTLSTDEPVGLPNTSCKVVSNAEISTDVIPALPKLYNSMFLSNSIIGRIALLSFSGSKSPASIKFCLWCQKLILDQTLLSIAPRCIII